ncbi:MAG TPA: hypothetical protein PL131_01995 [Methylotenera sp.]|nr:hypothetical protein [Methylotenera sp.]HPH04618.1 hypothetical protein [Methylotenera sp.]HPN01609.1 hypothetical protein [Methylotenera sp.]
MNKVSLPREYQALKEPHNPADPNPWQTLWLDNSVPIQQGVKQAWLYDSNTWSRQFLLPFVRPLARLTIVLLQIIKTIIPNWLTSSPILHRILARALAIFATPEANWLILRHFWIGSENLAFLNANIKGAGVEMNPLRPTDLPDLVDDLFIKHDLNLFNFISRLNLKLNAQGITEISPNETLDFSMITDNGDFAIAPQNAGMLNFVDLQTCIDIFTPVYQLFLTDTDFWRSVHSLQLDETIGIYAAKVLNKPDGLVLVNNKHPMVVPATWSAGYRLVLHGLSSEMLHAILVQAKRQSQQQLH